MKKIKKICLILAIVGMIGYASFAKADFFDWLRSIFLGYVAEETQEVPDATTTDDVLLLDDMCEPVIVIKEIEVEKEVPVIVYIDNPQQQETIDEQEIIILHQKNRIIELENRVNELDGQVITEQGGQAQSQQEDIDWMIVKDYKIEYLGFIPIEVMEKPSESRPEIDYYQVDFVVDTIIQVQNVDIKAVGGRQQVERVNSEMLSPNKWYLSILVLYPDESNWLIEIKADGKIIVSENIEDKIDKIELPIPPEFSNLTEEVNWINSQIDTRLDRCEEYSDKNYPDLYSCLKNL